MYQVLKKMVSFTINEYQTSIIKVDIAKNICILPMKNGVFDNKHTNYSYGQHDQKLVSFTSNEYHTNYIYDNITQNLHVLIIIKREMLKKP